MSQELTLEEILLIKASDLPEISARLSNALNVPDLSVYHLIRKSEQELTSSTLTRRNFGSKTLEELKSALARYGLSLNMSFSEIDDLVDGNLCTILTDIT